MTGIGDAAGPKDVGDPVELSAQVLVHRVPLARCLAERPTSFRSCDDLLEALLAEELDALLGGVQDGERRLEEVLEPHPAAGDAAVLEEGEILRPAAASATWRPARPGSSPSAPPRGS